MKGNEIIMRQISKRIPLVKSACLHDLSELFEDNKTNKQRLMSIANVPDDLQYQSPTYLPEKTLHNLIFEFGENTSNELFIDKIKTTCIENYVPSTLRILNLNNKSTVRDALEEFCKVIDHYSNNTLITVEKYHDSYWLARYKGGENEKWYKYGEMFTIIFMVTLLENLASSKTKTVQVSVKKPELAEYFKCKPLSHIQLYLGRNATGIKIDNDILEQKLNIESTFNLNCFDEPIPKSFIASFELAIKPYIHSGRLPISRAAKILGVHPRALQRQLKNSGVTYSNIIEDMMLKRCIKLFTYSKTSITEIAMSMGYADTANFTRFIRKNLGYSPLQYRKKYRNPEIS